MTQKTNYNIKALQGYDYDDADHARDIGIDVPRELLYTPEYNEYLLNAIREENIKTFTTEPDPLTNRILSIEEATKRADELRRTASEHIKALLKAK